MSLNCKLQNFLIKNTAELYKVLSYDLSVSFSTFFIRKQMSFKEIKVQYLLKNFKK